MIPIEAVVVQVRGVDRAALERWIDAALVRPEGEPGHWRFRDIDVARVRLIVELRREMRVEEQTLPLVLSLLDQLYDARRAMRRLGEAMTEVDEATRAWLRERLQGR
jgi:chaperone modulatory protein CbpM